MRRSAWRLQPREEELSDKTVEDSLAHPPIPSVEELVQWRMMLEEIEASLGDSDRSIFNLHYLMGYTTEEVSQMVGDSHAAIRQHLVRKVRPVVRDIFQKYGYHLAPEHT